MSDKQAILKVIEAMPDGATLSDITTALLAFVERSGEAVGKVEKPERKKDWRRTAGMFTGSEFMKDVDAEGAAIREAERKAAREGQTE